MSRFLLLFVNAKLQWNWIEFDNKKEAEEKFNELNSYKSTRVFLTKILKDTRTLTQKDTKEPTK